MILVMNLIPQRPARHPSRPDTPTPLYRPSQSPSDSDSDDDLPQTPMSPDPLATAQVNNVVACAAAILPQTYAQARKSVHWPEI
jgi:hypothetical protein